MRKIIFITGPSGVGKTTVTKHLQSRLASKASFYFFDTIEIPSVKEMISKYGSQENFQKDATQRWLDRLITSKDNLMFFEGQYIPEFINFTKLVKHNIEYKLICIFADRKIREERLIHLRSQPELANQDMENWQNALIAKTELLNGICLNSSEKTVEEIAKVIENEVLK